VKTGALSVNKDGTVDERSAAVRSGDVLVTKSGDVDGRSKAVKDNTVFMKKSVDPESKSISESVPVESKRTVHQENSRNAYEGEYKTDASHRISAEERKHFKLANKNDGPENYRQNNSFTNKSIHSRIDNHYLSQTTKHEFVAMTPEQRKYVHEGKEVYISPAEEAARIQAKIDVAKSTGDINDERFRNYLYKAAEANALDLRQFNGYN
jgi:hypothetical protein